jgi:hypothetical protein
MMGRMTNGGLKMTSRPLTVVATGVAIGEAVALSVGDGEVSGDGEGDTSGVGVVGGPCSAKVAQGLGATFAQRRCTPGGSPGNGVTLVAKLPLASAMADPATLLLGGSHNRPTCWFGKNADPLTEMGVLATPEVTSMVMNALGFGLGLGLGIGLGGGEGGGVHGELAGQKSAWTRPCSAGDTATRTAAKTIANIATTAELSHAWEPGRRMKPAKVSKY